MSIEDGHEIHQNRFQHIRIISLFHSFYQENPEIFQIMKNFVLAIQKTKKKTMEKIGIQKRKWISTQNKHDLDIGQVFFFSKTNKRIVWGKRKVNLFCTKWKKINFIFSKNVRVRLSLSFVSFSSRNGHFVYTIFCRWK